MLTQVRMPINKKNLITNTGGCVKNKEPFKLLMGT